MVKYYKVAVSNIDYCVEEQDLENSYYTQEEIAKAIQNIKQTLPQQLEVECECELDELGDDVADAISDQTGWLVNSFHYEIMLEI